MSCILVHVLLLLVFPVIIFLMHLKKKTNFYAYYSVFQTMFVPHELGCYSRTLAEKYGTPSSFKLTAALLFGDFRIQ